VNGLACENDRSSRREVANTSCSKRCGRKLLSKNSIAEYKARPVKRLRRPAIDTSKVRKVEAEIANLVQGRRRRYPLSIACGTVGSAEKELREFCRITWEQILSSTTAALDREFVLRCSDSASHSSPVS